MAPQEISMKKSVYRTNENTLISLSGGRTSGLLLHKTLQEYGGKLPDHVKVTFANTGKELPQTLDFVRDMETKWGVDVVWLEYGGRTPIKDSNKFKYSVNVVNYETASRNGEPFRQLLDDVSGLPNQRFRYCSGQLKIRTMVRHLKSIGWEKGWICFIGIRADEPRRAAKLHNKISEGQDCFCPLYLDKITKEDVGKFWANNDFDLDLPNNNGTTDWGNCDLCFLKGKNKRLSIAKQRPDLIQWWIDAETGKNDQFDRNGWTYAQMQVIASTQTSMFDYGDESISCFCGD